MKFIKDIAHKINQHLSPGVKKVVSDVSDMAVKGAVGAKELTEKGYETYVPEKYQAKAKEVADKAFKAASDVGGMVPETIRNKISEIKDETLKTVSEVKEIFEKDEHTPQSTNAASSTDEDKKS